MKSARAQTLLNDVDLTIKHLARFKLNPLHQSYSAKFLVVFICGVYEEVIENILTERVGRENSLEINRFIDLYLFHNFKSPNINNIKELLNKFNQQWASEIDKLPNIAKDSLDSIVVNRHAVAHGGETSVTLNDVINFYNASRCIIEKIDDMLL